MSISSGKKKVIIPGFKFAGIAAGIKKSGDKDLALIFSERPAVTAGLFTTNRIKAAPVKLAMDTIASRKGQAIIINSGNANACTGERGLRDARKMRTKTARELGISPELVYVSSTGIIGKPLPIKKIEKGLSALVGNLSPLSLTDAATAIMTTDTFTKITTKKIKINDKTGTVAGIAKGAGMVCPNMATMLSFIFTDIAVNPAALDLALKLAVNKSFNSISIDNDMSTNDTVMVMSNGLLGNRPLTKRSSFYQKFQNALMDVTYGLSRMITEDGEGATKLIEVRVKGARTVPDAEKAARAVSSSLLVKTAMYGRDPNWGRIMAAIGYSGVKINEQKIDIYLNKIKLVSKGTGTGRERDTKKILANKEIIITIDLGIGSKNAEALTCDLTEKYIKINALYGT
jgi:glutamate N-acetyltransferase/amino-acid N-acetyltransferase